MNLSIAPAVSIERRIVARPTVGDILLYFHQTVSIDLFESLTTTIVELIAMLGGIFRSMVVDYTTVTGKTSSRGFYSSFISDLHLA
jgi:hypothetical protein